jgi:SNF2 family DNA or RNA helicase
MIETGGTTALLWEPGTGKTAATIDFLSVLTLSRARRGFDETRALVVCPLAAVDTWVSQMKTYASPQVGFWAEALGGSIIQRAEALADRGGSPFARTPGSPRELITAQHLRKPSLLPAPPTRLRALHTRRSRAMSWRHSHDADVRQVAPQSPSGVHGPRLVVEVVNLDTFASRTAVGSRTMADVLRDAVGRYAPEIIIIDESHKIKGVSSNTSRALARIGRTVPRRIILTGTVMAHSPMDVFAQWRFLDPEAFSTLRADGTRKSLSYSSFEQRYAKLGGWMGRQVVGFQRLDEMQHVLAKRSSVVRKIDALDLPKTTDVIVRVNLTYQEVKAYESMKDTMAVSLREGSVVAGNRLAQMMRLRQITAGILPIPGNSDPSSKIPSGGSSKIKVIKSLVQDNLAGEKRIVIFAVFRDEIRALQAVLTVKGTEVMVITGDTPVARRMTMRKRFGSDAPDRIVMIAQIRTMSLAVNELVTANHAIFATLPYQRDDLVQARDRLHRLGQKLPVTFWYALAPKSVDEVVFTSHQKRTNLEQAMLHHVRDNQ